MKYFLKLSSEQLRRAIAWDTIVLGVINIFRVRSIIRVQFSGWQLFRCTYQQSIILQGHNLSANCPRANYLGDNFQRSNFQGTITQGAIILEAVVRGQLSWGSIVQGQLLGRQWSWGQLSGGQLSGGQLSCSHTGHTVKVDNQNLPNNLLI